MLKIKRVYEKKEKSDGYRVLVDRLWPRGVSRKEAALDMWMKETAPSDALRKWYGHDVKKWRGFVKKYNEELADNREKVDELREVIKEQKNVTLLYGARDTEHNEAVVLLNYLKKSV